MRKAISTLMMTLAVVAVYAQTPNGASNEGKSQPVENNFIPNDVTPLISKEDISVDDWFYFVDDWAALSGGFRDGNTFFSIFPDSVRNISLNDENKAEINTQGWYGIGQMFQAQDPNWGNADLGNIGDGDFYEVDEVEFLYGYFRYTDTNVVDTLVVQIYNSSQITSGTFPNIGDGSPFGVVKYDSAKRIGANYTEIHKIPLTGLDSNQLNDEGRFTAKTYTVTLNSPMRVPGNGACGFTVCYLPGSDYGKPGAYDTLYYDNSLEDFGIDAPKKRLNRFGILARTQTPVYTKLDARNNGMFLNTAYRYGDDQIPAFMKNHFYANSFSSETEQFGYYPWMGFKVRTEYELNISINESDLENGYGLGNVFPNPATNNAEMHLTFAVAQKEQVAINVYDLTGKIVKTLTSQSYEQGQHTIDFSSADFSQGMYIYTMTAGAYTSTGKFSVAK